VAVDASLLTMVPADTVAMGAMRVKPLVKTAAWKKLLEQPEKVRMVTMHASLVDGVAMEFDAICADETGAKQVHDSLRGLVGLARIAMPAPQRDAWLPVLDGVEVTQNQATAVLKARLTVDQVERAQASLPARKAAEKKAE
jgi:hypothetical protein